MDDAKADTTMSTNDSEFLCVDVMPLAMVSDCHRPTPNQHLVLLYSNESVDVVSDERCQLDGDLAEDPSLDDLDNRDRRNRLVPRYFYSRWKKSKFHSYNNETQVFR